MVVQKLFNLNSIVTINETQTMIKLNAYFEMHQLDVMVQQQFVPCAERVISMRSRISNFVYILSHLIASTW